MSKEGQRQISRRDLVKRTATLAATLLTSECLPQSNHNSPQSPALQPSRSPGVVPKNNKNP